MGTQALSREGVQFAWASRMVGRRVCYYPPEERNRAEAYSDRCWSRVETLPCERLREIQLLRLKTLARHVQESSPFYAFWLCHYAAEMMGCQVVPKGPLPTQAWLGLMKRLTGTARSFMCATPTYAQRLLEVASETGIDPKQLGIRLLTMAGEPGACVPATKAHLEKAWGAKAHDIFGSTEVSGPVAPRERRGGFPRR